MIRNQTKRRAPVLAILALALTSTATPLVEGNHVPSQVPFTGQICSTTANIWNNPSSCTIVCPMGAILEMSVTAVGNAGHYDARIECGGEVMASCNSGQTDEENLASGCIGKKDAVTIWLKPRVVGKCTVTISGPPVEGNWAQAYCASRFLIDIVPP